MFARNGLSNHSSAPCEASNPRLRAAEKSHSLKIQLDSSSHCFASRWIRSRLTDEFENSPNIFVANQWLHTFSCSSSLFKLEWKRIVSRFSHSTAEMRTLNERWISRPPQLCVSVRDESQILRFFPSGKAENLSRPICSMLFPLSALPVKWLIPLYVRLSVALISREPQLPTATDWLIPLFLNESHRFLRIQQQMLRIVSFPLRLFVNEQMEIMRLCDSCSSPGYNEDQVQSPNKGFRVITRIFDIQQPCNQELNRESSGEQTTNSIHRVFRTSSLCLLSAPWFIAIS